MRQKLDLLCGQAALEFAAILIPFLLSAGLVLDGSRLFLAYSEANAAASDIARLAATQASNGLASDLDESSYAANMGLPSDARVTVTQSTEGMGALDAHSYRIEAAEEGVTGESGAGEEASDEAGSGEDAATAVDVSAKTAAFTCVVTIPVSLIFPLWGAVPGISEGLTASTFYVTAEAVAYGTVERTGEVVS